MAGRHRDVTRTPYVLPGISPWHLPPNALAWDMQQAYPNYTETFSDGESNYL